MNTTIFAQGIKGNGIVEKENRPVAAFDKINIGGVMNVYLEQSDVESVTVEADKNIIPYITTSVKDNELLIGIKDNTEIKKSKKLNVYVSLRNISKLDIGSVGNVECKNTLHLSSLKLDNSSVGDVSLKLDCSNFNAMITSVGNTILSGKADEAGISVEGVGNLKAFDFAAGILKIKNSGVGNAKVSAVREIYLELEGVGNITYKGDPVVKQLKSDGVGKIKKD